MRLNPNADAGLFEKRALRITGTAFYLLAVGLIITAGINLYQSHRPEATLLEIIIAAISIFTMWALIYFKIKAGRQLNSDAIMEDVNCTKACLYLFFTLLLASFVLREEAGTPLPPDNC
jgi:divalent metal cation (Fe/Co/Zn/Cd) transporter